MLKEQFNSLSVTEQVDYINSQLPLKTLTKTCNEIEIARSTIAGRFKKKGYTLNLEQNKYILNIKPKEILIPCKASDKNNNDVAELLGMKDKIKAVINWFDDMQLHNEKVKSEFKIRDFKKDEAISRTFVVYSKVLERYINFCETHEAYKRQDIFSQALVEFLDKYE
jgi:hypothetical protein